MCRKHFRGTMQMYTHLHIVQLKRINFVSDPFGMLEISLKYQINMQII